LIHLRKTSFAMSSRRNAPALLLAGLASLVAAAVAVEFGVLHMRGILAAYGPICGAGAPHCAACPAALALLSLGLGLLAAAAAPQPERVRSRGR
jgi:hypothetical protein